MNVAATILKLINGYKTYSSVILAVVSGIGLILSKDYSGGVSTIFQALTVFFSGTTVVGLRHAIAKAETARAGASA